MKLGLFALALFCVAAPAQAQKNVIDPMVTDGQVKKDDPRILEIQKLVHERKKQQPDLPDQTIVIDPIAESREIGNALAKTQGGQFVLVGGDHNETDQWLVLMAILESYEKSKSKDDRRPLILVNEEELLPGELTLYRKWNAMEVAKRHAGQLGFLYVTEARHYESYQQRLDKFAEVMKTENKIICYIPYPYFLDKLSAMRPDVNIYAIDNNHSAENLVTEEQDLNFADRDTMMTYNMRILRSAYPDALIVGIFGYNHVVERMRDAPGEPLITKWGVNANDPLAEQLSLLYETPTNKNVWTIRAIAFDEPLNHNSLDQEVIKDVGQFDKIIYMNAFDKSKPWQNPWATKNSRK